MKVATVSKVRHSAPYIVSTKTSNWIMNQVLIALIFPIIAAYYFFGIRSFVMIGFSVVLCVVLEYSYQKALKKEVTIGDKSAVITGILLALTLPTTTPFWTLMIGAFIAIILVKQVGGGIGKNILNPAVTARVALKLFFSPWITNWISPGVDAVSTATPLKLLGDFPYEIHSEIPTTLELFLGLRLGGPIGETSKFVLLLSGAYLIWKKIIDPIVPIVYLTSFFIYIFGYSSFDLTFSLTHLLSGTLIFASIFMITDYSTTPWTRRGKILFAFGCGIVTALIRLYMPYFDGGVGIAIIVMNLATPYINKVTMPRIYGSSTRIKIDGQDENKFVLIKNFTASMFNKN